MTILNRLTRTQNLSNVVLVVITIALFLYFALQSHNFMSPGNILTLMNNAAALGVVVVPFTLLVISGNVDFSIGSTAALTGTVTAIAVTQMGTSEFVGIGLGLAAAVVVGVINGFLCAVLEFNPIIVTLGMLGTIRGVTLLIQSDQIYGIGPVIEGIGTGTFLGVPLTLVIAAIIFILGGLFLTLTPSGRHVFAIGVNRRAAFLTALPIRALPFGLYVATSVGAGLAGIVFMARLNGVSPAATGSGLEFQALTVVLLGGVAFAGGRGSLFGVLIAWLFLAALQNGLVLMNVTPYVQTVAAGVALVFAATLDGLGSILGPKIQAKRANRGRLITVRT
jgi:ribose/xylose/arabinose/galactoside ABC-type transport system permease subunit